MTKEIFENLSNIFWTVYSKEGLLPSSPSICNEVVAILNILGISKKGDCLHWKDQVFPNFRASMQFSVTPYEIGLAETEKIERIFESLQDDAKDLSILFDAIGYILIPYGSTIHIEFIGSSTWEIWNDKYMKMYKDSPKDWDGIWMNDPYSLDENRYDFKNVDWTKPPL